MLNLEGLSKDIQTVFETVLPGAFEASLQFMLPQKSDEGDEMIKDTAETITTMVSEPLARGIATAIDYYIKCGEIKGTIITTGSPVTQTAQIIPINMGNPVAGAVPNTLGIQ